jgi:hypothetical protein
MDPDFGEVDVGRVKQAEGGAGGQQLSPTFDDAPGIEIRLPARALALTVCMASVGILV